MTAKSTVKCEMFIFLTFLFNFNLVNFKAVIANWIHEQCDTVFHSETLRCQTVGVCWMGV